MAALGDTICRTLVLSLVKQVSYTFCVLSREKNGSSWRHALEDACLVFGETRVALMQILASLD